jgi:hypothetical protein
MYFIFSSQNYNIVPSSLFEDKTHPFISSFKLRGTENVYTQHRPFITKDLLPGANFRPKT